MTLRLNGSNSGFTEVKAPATAGSNTITLPTSNGSANQYLKNGSTAGTLEFGTLPSSGKILQVLSTAKVDHFSTASGTFTDVTGLSQAITTSSSTNKVLVIVNMSIGAPWWTANPEINLVRGSTNLLQATGGSTYNASIIPLYYAANSALTASMIVNQTITFLDSPGSAAAHTYKIQVKHIAVNKSDTNASYGSTSTITCMEVAA